SLLGHLLREGRGGRSERPLPSVGERGVPAILVQAKGGTASQLEARDGEEVRGGEQPSRERIPRRVGAVPSLGRRRASRGGEKRGVTGRAGPHAARGPAASGAPEAQGLAVRFMITYGPTPSTTR